MEVILRSDNRSNCAKSISICTVLLGRVLLVSDAPFRRVGGDNDKSPAKLLKNSYDARGKEYRGAKHGSG